MQGEQCNNLHESSANTPFDRRARPHTSSHNVSQQYNIQTTFTHTKCYELTLSMTTGWLTKTSYVSIVSETGVRWADGPSFNDVLQDSLRRRQGVTHTGRLSTTHTQHGSSILYNNSSIDKCSSKS